MKEKILSIINKFFSDFQKASNVSKENIFNKNSFLIPSRDVFGRPEQY
jgi:hypothetical protein